MLNSITSTKDRTTSLTRDTTCTKELKYKMTHSPIWFLSILKEKSSSVPILLGTSKVITLCRELKGSIATADTAYREEISTPVAGLLHLIRISTG
jgi:hypothetical protein